MLDVARGQRQWFQGTAAILLTVYHIVLPGGFPRAGGPVPDRSREIPERRARVRFSSPALRTRVGPLLLVVGLAYGFGDAEVPRGRSVGMSRRSNGLIGTWAEAQRQQQRQQEAQRRAQAQFQREQERRQRAHERDLARSQREQQAAYRQHREGDARRRTEELDARVQTVTSLLASGCRAPAFRTALLTR